MKNVKLSRRSFIGDTATLAATSMMPNFANAAKLNSKFNGVQIGVTAGSFGRMLGGSAKNMLKYVTQCGINSIDRNQPYRFPVSDRELRSDLSLVSASPSHSPVS